MPLSEGAVRAEASGERDRAATSPDILFLKYDSSIYSDSHPTLHVVHGRAKPVLHGPNMTVSKETAYGVG